MKKYEEIVKRLEKGERERKEIQAKLKALAEAHNKLVKQVLNIRFWKEFLVDLEATE